MYGVFVASIGNVPAAKRIRVARREGQTHCEGACKVEGLRNLALILMEGGRARARVEAAPSVTRLTYVTMEAHHEIEIGGTP